jgi:long-chain fatty acid transport protein
MESSRAPFAARRVASRTRLFALGFSFALWASLTTAARANVQEVFGLSPKAIGMGNAFTSVADDFSACYYNPAGLGRHRSHEFFLGYAFSQPRLKQYLLSKPEVRNAVEMVHFRSILFGTLVDLTRIVDTRGHGLVLGVAATAGDNFKAAWRIHDWNPQVPRFIRNGDAMNRAHVFSGVGAELIEGALYVGGGINLWETINVENLAVKMDLSGTVLSKEVDVNGDFDFAPIVGVLVKPFDWLSVAYAYRGQMAQDDPTHLNATSAIGALEIPIHLFMHFRDYFLPWNMTVGVSARPLESVLVSFDGTFYHWSDFDLPVWHGRYPPWDDTFVPRIGCELTVAQGLKLRTGYYYEPSPVPDQGKATSNYLDFTKHVVSLGAGYTFSELPGIGPLPLRYPVSVDAFFQYQIMEPRTQEKEPATGQEGWRIKGYQYSLGLGVSIGF